MKFWHSFIIVSALIGISQEKVSYEELKALQVECDPYDTCNTTQDNIEDPLRSCQCDNSCHRYEDCCLDAPNRVTTESRNIICLNMKSSHSYFAISTCKETWKDVDTKRKCERSPNSDDPYSLIPVTNRRSRATYKNRYCAKCNQDEQGLEFWKIGVTCELSNANINFDIQKDLVYNSSLKTWGVRLPDHTFLKCNIEPVAPQNKQHLRPCYSNMISKCLPNWEDDSIREKCQSYTAVILGNRKTKTYRNVHCAICNGVDVRDLDCLYLIPRMQLPGNANFVCLFSVGNCICENKVRDTAFGKCRELTCGLPFLEYKDGKCVKKT